MLKIFTFCFVFAAGILSAQDATWRQFYPNSSVNSLAARGNTILVATQYGITRFDTLGNATVYDNINQGVPFRQALQVAVDYAGQWWVAHYGGVARYDGSNWSVWDSTQVGLSFYSSNVTALRASPDGRIGICTNNAGCIIFENNAWSTLTTGNSGLPSNVVRDMAFGNDGKVYFATAAGLAVQDGANWTIYNTANTGIAGFDNCKSVALNSDGIVWVTESTARFAKLEAGVWTEYAPAGIGLPGVGFSLDVVVDGQDRLWVNFTKSVSMLNDTTWTHYLEADIGCTLLQLPTNKTKPAIDGAGHYWSKNCTLTQFDGQNWNQMDFGNTPALPGAVYAMTQDSAGNMWFGGDFADNEAHIAKKDGETWQTYSLIDLGFSGPSNEVFTAHGDVSGNVWFGMIGGDILRFDGVAWSIINDVNLAYPEVEDYWTINSDADGTVWFAGIMNAAVRTNLIRYKAGEWTYFTGDVLSIPSANFILSIAFGPGNTSWFLSNSNQLLRFDDTNWSTIDIADSGLPFTFVHQMAVAPDGAVWVATNGGLARFDGTAWTTLTTANSDIPSDDIFRIRFDKAGGMYIGFNPDGLTANIGLLRGGEWIILLPPGFDPGFSSEPYGMFTDRDNRLWFNGFQGTPPVFLYDPALVNTTMPAGPEVALTVFPNPVSEVLHAHIPDWDNQPVSLFVTDPSGRRVHHQTTVLRDGLLTLPLPAQLPSGIYYIEVVNDRDQRKAGRFVRTVQH